tara:strand:- start:64 stop:1092 length:1029 start_codon:yes stop_codon:yes gene_type:complete
MLDNVSFFIIALSILILNFLFNKLNLIKDMKNTSFHKKFIDRKFEPPFSGGIFIILTMITYLNATIILKFFLVTIFLIGFFSDINLLKSINLRFYLQLISIILIIYFSDLYIQSIRIEFIDNLLNNHAFKLFFTTFCILILINGSNFLDGVNTLVIGYYMLVIYFMSSIDSGITGLIEDNFINLLIFSLSILFILNFFNLLLLGDNGSYLISVFVGIYLIDLANNNVLISPYFVMNLLWYPAYETLFSIIRKVSTKKSALSPDNLHLHQLVYVYLKDKIPYKYYANSLSGILINIYNLIIFYFASQDYSNTKYQLILFCFSFIIYNFLYLALNSYQKKKLIN